MQFSDNGRIMFVSETGGSASEVAVYLDEGNKAYTVIAAPAQRARWARQAAPAGAAPRRRVDAAVAAARVAAGPSLVTRPGTRGAPVVMISDRRAACVPQGRRRCRPAQRPAAAPAAPPTRPPARRSRGSTGSTSRPARIERIYESTSDLAETISAPLDDDFSKAIISRESAKDVPQSFILDLKTKDAKQITSNKDLMPEITNAIRKTVIGTRADGHTFQIKVTLPADWKPGTRLPALFWFYPAEFDSQEAYDRPAPVGRRGPAARIASRRTARARMAFITTVGYALIEPDTPIFAQNGQPPNDHYVDDLRDDLTATIDALDTLGFIDRQRLAIGGHSYGAFSTVNAMVHTPFFKAGIAGDGNYNRTLTPNGLPERAARPLGRPRDLPRHVAVPLRRSPQRRAADVPLDGRPERRHRSDQLDPHVPGAAGARQDRGAVHVSV